MSVHVASVGMGRFGKRPEGLIDLAAEAGEAALDGVGRKPIDLLVVGSMFSHGPYGPEALLPRLAGRLSLESANGLRIDGASATGALAFHAAVLALESNRFDRALVIAAEKMTDRSTADNTRDLATSLHTSEVAAGATMPLLAAIVSQRYLDRYGGTPAWFDAASLHARTMALDNPNAHFFGKRVTAAEISSSKPVALPLRVMHCSAMSDGAVAVVLERGQGPATVLGLGQGFEALRVVDRNDLTSFAATRIAAKRAYEASHLTRKEVEVAEVHDAFSPFTLIHIEDLGFCGPGEAPTWFERGWVHRDGRLPVNPSGGVVGRGHPVAASGLAEVAEVALQLRGEAGQHQIARRPKVGLAQAVGGVASHNLVTILGKEGP
ncbi:MAG TPA: thiolase family protein [Thermoplasmata archaeon]|nr:thiolase family protein [Thermoplasmata archaeon]